MTSKNEYFVQSYRCHKSSSSVTKELGILKKSHSLHGNINTKLFSTGTLIVMQLNTD